MEKILILIICLWLLVTVVFMLATMPWKKIATWAIRFVGKKNDVQPKGDATLHELNKEENKQVLSMVLEQLHCEPKWEESEGRINANFDYQGGHFTASIIAGNPNIEISYAFVFDTSMEHLTLVRTICNRFNIAPVPVKFVYSIREDGKMIDLHIIGTFLIDKYHGKSVMTYALRHMFEGQRAFVSKYNAMECDNMYSEAEGFEEYEADMKREWSLIHEFEIACRKSPKGMSHTMAAEGGLKVSQLFSNLLDIEEVEFVSMTVMGKDENAKIIEGTENIANCNVETFFIDEENGVFTHNELCCFVEYKEKGKKHNKQLAILLTKDMEKPQSVLYYRVTLVTIPSEISPKEPLSAKSHTSRSASALVAHDFTQHQQLLDEFECVWKEAIAKENDGDRSTMTKEQKYLIACKDVNIAQSFYLGRKLYLRSRTYEALPLLLDAYYCLTSTYRRLDIEWEEFFGVVCYLIGSCYMTLNRFEEAYYFLNSLDLDRDTRYMMQMTNCLVGCDNVFVESFLIDRMDEMVRDAPVDELEQYERELYYFLQRQYVKVLLRKRKMGKAEDVLKSMLENPETSDYALLTLAHMQGLNNKEQ